MNAQRMGVALVISILIAGPAAATGWRWGARAGVNGANFAGEFGDAVKPHLRYGLNAGLAAEAVFTPALSLHAEAAYSSKGGKTKEEVTDNAGNIVGGFDDVWTFNYVEIPLLLRARLLSRGRMGLFGELGPSLGLALSGKFKSAASGFPDLDLKPHMNSVDVGFAAGLGLDHSAGPGRLGLEARYTRGFSDLYDFADNASSINQVWTLALSWMR